MTFGASANESGLIGKSIDVSCPALYQNDTVWPLFAHLRQYDPVHFCEESAYGPYWSITKYRDIQDIELNPKLFSSAAELGGILIFDQPSKFVRPNLIRSDPPKHDQQRKIISPIVAPTNLAQLEATIRDRAIAILESLPRGEEFDWVEHVSIELTTQMLTTLLDFPWEERRKLTYWSDVATAEIVDGGVVRSEEQRFAVLEEMTSYFAAILSERAARPPKHDLISMLAHGEATRDMPPRELMGNLVLLVVGGNDTTRNSISGGLLALHEHPDEYAKLITNPALVGSMVPEIVRWQTPVIHMRRTATEDTDFRGKKLSKGDKVVLWYVSGNRDATAIDDPDKFIIDRRRPREHLSFGFGVHRCVGNRLAELQLRILWEEILTRLPRIDVVAPPVRTFSNFARGFTSLRVRIPD